jgi:hypothetical protein
VRICIRIVKGGSVMETGKRRRQTNWPGIGLRGLLLLPLLVGALLGATQALVLLCVLAFILLPL